MCSNTKYLDTDILVIGGGAAGAKAVMDAHDAGLKVCMVVKSFLGKSGCSIFAGNLNYFAPPEDGQDQDEEARIMRTVNFNAKYTHYLGNQEYFKKTAAFTMREFYPWIEEKGLYIIRLPDGQIVSDLPRRTSAWAVQQGASGTIVSDMLRKEVFRRGIQVFEETSGTRLLKNGDRVVGAVALDYRNGEVLVIRAKAVILATGHSNYLALRATGTREGTGAGWVMAYEAGAELQNLEMQWFHASDVAWPRAWMRLHLYPNPLANTEKRSQLFNSLGEFFFDGNFFMENPVPYIMQLKYLVKQVMDGKARFDGGYYSSYRHIEPENLEKYFYQNQFIRKLGLDLQKDLIENGITWHMNVGGVRVKESTMESGVPGLYIAGSVGGLVTGGLPNVIYDGTIAAAHAGEQAKTMELPSLDQEQVDAEVNRVYGFLRTEPGEGLLPAQVKKEIRKVMWENMNYIKNETKMQKALEELERIRETWIPRMRLESTSGCFNYSWMEALDVVDMLEACKLVTSFSLYRKESRGAFFREDYQQTDNKNWLKHSVGRLEQNGLKLRSEEVDLRYAKPKEDIADFFAVDY